MRSGSFVVRVPHADYRAFSVHTTALDGALLVWCGAARELEASDVGDAELQRALLAAGRAPATNAGPQPGHLAADWAVAMAPPGPQAEVCSRAARMAQLTRQTARGTSLYRSANNVALPMAQRIGAYYGTAMSGADHGQLSGLLSRSCSSRWTCPASFPRARRKMCARFWRWKSASAVHAARHGHRK